MYAAPKALGKSVRHLCCISVSRMPPPCPRHLRALAQSWIERNASSFSVDFAMPKYNLLREKWYMYGQAGPRCEHVFRELYENAAYFDL